jgi:membrane protein implicated in regulation of membrane protease activity
MIWWMWVLVGLGLLVVEVVTPGGLFALFFGLGALGVALLSYAGVGATWQWIAFTLLSVGLLLGLRRTLRDRLAASGAPVDTLVGEQAVLLQDLAAGDEGKAELRGTPWNARAASDVPLLAGQRCRVERVDGLTLWLRAE